MIKGSNQNKLLAIKDWIDTKVDKQDFGEKVRANLGEVVVAEDEFKAGEYSLHWDVYLKSSVNKSKYKDIIVNQFTSLNKKGLSHAYIDKYDECSHDSDNPQPCTLTRVLEWKA